MNSIDRELFVCRSQRLALAVCVLLAACGGSSAPNQPPVARAAISGEAVLNAPTTFDTTGTNDPDGGITSRSWNYGDGQTGSVDSHTYTSIGAYTATLTVTDSAGATAIAALPVTVAKCSSAGTQAARLSPFTTACLQTTQGEIVLEVYTTQAPTTSMNFLRYLDEGFYNGVLFHRVMPGFVIQAGAYLPGLVRKPPTHAPIALESNNGLKNWQYTVAMARANAPDSATSEFFINLVDNHPLDYNAATAGANGYTVFGQVISGTAVVDAIGQLPTRTVASAGLSDVPLQDVVIRSAIRMP